MCFTSPAFRCATSISPPTSIVSLLYVMEDGASAEIAVVGNEGVVGVSLFMGGETTHQPGAWCKAPATPTG